MPTYSATTSARGVLLSMAEPMRTGFEIASARLENVTPKRTTNYSYLPRANAGAAFR